VAHHTAKASYEQLSRRLNKFPVGAPPSELFYDILAMLFTEREARLVSRLPVAPFKAADAARAWATDTPQAERELDRLVERSLLIDTCFEGERRYFLPPPMAGFFEFSMMRTDGRLDKQTLAELFHQYMNVEEDFVRELYEPGETQLGRALVHEPALDLDDDLHVLDYERASAIIGDASHLGVGLCYCRHKMEHVGKACEAPLELCLSLNAAAETLIRQGVVRPIDRVEGLDLLAEAYEHDLVQFAENVRQGVNFICNCCRCCCETMIAARRFAVLRPVHTTRFMPVLDEQACSGCGRCTEVCPVEAMRQELPGVAPVVDRSVCIGCGVCSRSCGRRAILLTVRPERIITPLDSAHRTVVMAIERGKLQNLIFSEQGLASHRALAAVLGVILRLPPVKQIMASEQIKSRYLEGLIARHRYW
jgi:MinD superfamily P-loop ATPase containing an inserted ferredoxin domain